MNEDTIKKRIDELTEELAGLAKQRLAAVQLQQDIVNKVIQTQGAIAELKKLIEPPKS